ncbi:MAG: glycosyltransferase family 4 protein, partial [bacterium]
MKVAVISQPLDAVLPPRQNSIGIWTYKFAEHFSRLGQVLVYCKWRPRQKAVIRHEKFEYHFVPAIPNRLLQKTVGILKPFHKTRRPAFAASYYNLEYILLVALHLRKQGCDIVHVHNFSQFVPVIRALNPKCKIVLHMHCQWLTQMDRDMIETRLRKTDLVIGCCNFITEKIQGRFPGHADRCFTVHNGVDVEQFENPPARCGARTTIEPETDVPRKILFVGRVSPEKGVHTLLEAFRLVVERYPGVQLEIVGPVASVPVEFIVNLSEEQVVTDLMRHYRDADYYAGILASLPEKVRQRVFFCGFVPHREIAAHIRGADVLVNSSYSEAFPLPILEAMAAGLPVVATRVGGVAEAVEHEGTGLLVEAGDAGALARSLLRLLEDDQLRRGLGAA